MVSIKKLYWFGPKATEWEDEGPKCGPSQIVLLKCKTGDSEPQIYFLTAVSFSKYFNLPQDPTLNTYMYCLLVKYISGLYFHCLYVDLFSVYELLIKMTKIKFLI